MTVHPRPASLARRALPAVAVLGASGVLLTRLGGTSEAVSQTTTATPSGAAAKAPTTTARNGAGTTPTTITPPTTTRPRATTGPGSVAAPAAPATTTAPAAATGDATGTCTGTTYTGQVFDNRYGSVQVAAVVGADKKLCDVKVLLYPDGDRKSLAINQRALPTLHAEAVAAKSATIAGVTGATLTSNGYRSSLQSALDQVR